MRKGVLVAALFSMTLVAQGQVDASEQPKRVLVERSINSSFELPSEDVVFRNKARKREVVTTEVPKGMTVKQYINELKNEDGVLRVEEDVQYQRLLTPTDDLFSSSYHHEYVRSERAWGVTKGKNVMVAVIDDGVDVNHPEFSGRIVAPYDAVQEKLGTVDAGEHGTHVAGIIAGGMNGVGTVGVAPDAKIMPVDVFSGDTASSSYLIRGIKYAVDAGADIINMSLGSNYYSSLLNDAVQYAHSRGVLVIAAAGNDGTSQKTYPAALNNVIAVAATDDWDNSADYSNYGNWVDVSAPGSDILSTLPGGDYGYMTGTSMASPVAAGVAALVWSKNPTWTNGQVANQLLATADDLYGEGFDEWTGYGRVNASQALKLSNIWGVTHKAFYNKSVKVYVDSYYGSYLDNLTTGSESSYEWAQGLSGINVTTDGKYSVTYYDEQGYMEPVVEFTIDKTAPKITMTTSSGTAVSSGAYTKSSVKVTVSDKNLKSVTAKRNGTAFTWQNGVTHTTSGKYEITAYDKAGNKTVTTFTIDKTAPKITMTTSSGAALTSGASTKSSVKVTVSDTNLKSVTAKRNGVAFTFKNGVTHTTTGKYEITAYDKAGNKTVKTFTIYR